MSKEEVTERKINLFEEFSSINTDEWKKQIEKDIKGSDYTKHLIWKTYEGFNVEPFYTLADLEELSYLTDSLPGEYPFVRGNSQSGNEWEICEEISDINIESSNKIAKEALLNGADSIAFSDFSVNSAEEISRLLKDIPLDQTKLNFNLGLDNLELFDLLITESKKIKIEPLKLSGALYFSPLNDLLSNGFLPHNSDDCFQKIKEFITEADSKAPNYKTLAVNSDSFSDAGSNIVQELAFSLAMGCEYLIKLEKKGLGTDLTLRKMIFQFSVSSNYFMEIAKLRAARILWAKIVEKFNPEGNSSHKMTIHCKISRWNKTLYDPYVNILRGTVESMAAIIGGCDSLSVLPFDCRYESSKESNRLARNTQLILREEAYLHRITDPGSGSYYIEKLTDTIANEVLQLFQSVEKNGGFIQCVENSYIQDQIREVRNSKTDDVKTRKNCILGTNKFPNPSERVLNQLNIKSDRNSANSNTIKKGGITNGWRVKQLRKINMAEMYENLRLATEEFEKEFGKVPKVFLLKIGNPSMRSVRATFSANFFGCAGYEVIEDEGFENICAGIEKAIESGAEIVAVCSSDKEYLEFGAEVIEKIKSAKPEAIVVIAGYPRNIVNELEQAGVDDFIHVGSNAYELLSKYHEKLGIQLK